METAEKISRLSDKYNLAASYDRHQPDTRASPGLTALVDRATKGANHVFFGEPHIDGMVVKQYELMANNPEMFKAAAANGVKHLALELPNRLQPGVDSYMSGKSSRADFSDRLDHFQVFWAEGDARTAFKQNLIQTVDNAKAAGMKVYFADVKGEADLANYEAPSVKDLERKILGQYIKEKPDMKFEDYVAMKFDELSPEETAKLRRDMEEHTEQWRMKRFDDTAQYLYLRERVPPHEGIMGVVGMDHLNNALDKKAGRKIMGIDDHLEAEGKKVTTIEVHTEKTKGFTSELAAETKSIPQDAPDYVINLDKQTIESSKDGAVARMDGATDIHMADRRAPAQPAAAVPSF